MSTRLEYGNVSPARFPNPSQKRYPSTVKGTNPGGKKKEEKEENEALVIQKMAPIGLDAFKKMRWYVWVKCLMTTILLW